MAAAKGDLSMRRDTASRGRRSVAAVCDAAAAAVTDTLQTQTTPHHLFNLPGEAHEEEYRDGNRWHDNPSNTH